MPIPAGPRYATLDLWRGIACLFIVILHSAHYANERLATADPLGKGILIGISKMGIGVPMFFVISGYCISATCDSTRRKKHSLRAFFYRRFRRIFPPYLIAASICAGLVVLLTMLGKAELVSDSYGNIPHPASLSWSQWIGNITLTETWRPNVFGEAEKKIVGPAWTLCYEEQFYAVCGVLLLLPARWFFIGTGAVTALVCGTAAAGFAGWLTTKGTFLDGRWLMFAEGVMVYCLLNYAKKPSLGICIFAGLLVAAFLLRWQLRSNIILRERSLELIASTGFAIALLSLRSWDKQLAGTTVLRPIAICGQMCYSLYLIHWPIVVMLTNAFYLAGIKSVWGTLLLTLPICLAASLAASWVFHVVVERKFMNVTTRD